MKNILSNFLFLQFLATVASAVILIWILFCSRIIYRLGWVSRLEQFLIFWEYSQNSIHLLKGKYTLISD